MSDRERAAEMADFISTKSSEHEDDGYAIFADKEGWDMVARALRAYAAPQNEAAGEDAEIGRSIVAAIGRQVSDPSSPLYEWSPAERYDEVIGDLVEMVNEARGQRPVVPEEMVEKAAPPRDVIIDLEMMALFASGAEHKPSWVGDLARAIAQKYGLTQAASAPTECLREAVTNALIYAAQGGEDAVGQADAALSAIAAGGYAIVPREPSDDVVHDAMRIACGARPAGGSDDCGTLVEIVGVRVAQKIPTPGVGWR